MNVFLYGIRIIDRQQKVPFLKKKILWFTFTKKEYPVYEYHIEFRADEGRFWYCECKPCKVPNKDYYTYQENSLLTKNGLKKSLKIVDDIKDRILKVFQINKVDDTQFQVVERSIDKQTLDQYSIFDRPSKSEDSKQMDTIFLK
jgi:hypothetical protein